MATLVPPKLLLLDEHTAALDPRTSVIIMDVTKKLIEENKITTLMVTHNMSQALDYGNRLLMMHEGKLVEDLRSFEKSNLSTEKLITMFKENTGSLEDKMVL